MRKLATLTAVAAIVAAFGFATNAIAADQVVNDDVFNVAEPAPCNVATFNLTIQDGIDAAMAGDDVAVCPGTYVEDLEFTTNGLTIAAVDRTDKANTVIQGTFVVQPPLAFPECGEVATSGGLKLANINISANGVTITGFTIQSPAILAAGEYTCGLITDGTDNKIYHNRFLVSSGGQFGSMAIQTWALLNGTIRDNSGLTIIANQFDSSTIDTPFPGGRYFGVFINPQSEPTDRNPVIIAGNKFDGNLRRGVSVQRSFTDVKNNDIETELGNGEVGIQLDETTNSKVLDNEIEGDDGTFFFGIFLTDTAVGNVLADNEVENSREFDCRDASLGGGTAGTGNTWVDNVGALSSPLGICVADNDD